MFGTSCTLTAKEFDVPASGTMAHSFIQAFDSEYEAFKTYAENYPNDCTLLIDTYDTLNSVIHNAINCFNEVLLPNLETPTTHILKPAIKGLKNTVENIWKRKLHKLSRVGG